VRKREASPADPDVARSNGQCELKVKNGVVLIGADLHAWPGHETPVALRAFCKFARDYRRKGTLKAVIMNGDSLDFASISRWPLVEWQEQPSVQEEIDAAVVSKSHIE
jgi:hypothetical protein